MSKIYKQVEEFVIDSFTKIKKERQIKHFLRTVDWIKELKPDADDALLISAVAHDIERAFRSKDVEERKGKYGFTDKNFFRPHEERGAEIMVEFLRRENADSELIEKVKTLISRHEEGGSDEQNLLKDADSISFFENNVPMFLNRIKKNEKEKVREKFDWMYNRITSKEAKRIAKDWHENAIRDLELK